jgi:hypothetical protein
MFSSIAARVPTLLNSTVYTTANRDVSISFSTERHLELSAKLSRDNLLKYCNSVLILSERTAKGTE